MRNMFRYGRVGWIQLALAGFIVWLAQASLIEKDQMSGAPAAQRPAAQRPTVIERAPLRFIKDPNPNLSAVAVNSDSNMLVVSDENMFRIMEYDRRENTPP